MRSNPTELIRSQILGDAPTDEQKNAIFSEDREFVLRAAPGSGKTWTASRRFLWRGATWTYNVGGLALLSFTNVAVHEFKAATARVGRRDLLSDPNYVGTFDAFVERFVLGPFGHVLTNQNRRPRLYAAERPGHRKIADLVVWVDGPKAGQKRQVPAWEIIPVHETKKIRLVSRYGNKELGSAAKNAVKRLFSMGYYTHEQRLFWACVLLAKRPHLAHVLARRFPEIIVDEAQDCNPWLFEFLSHLRAKGTKVTLIGDPDQCIFEFSRADADALYKLQTKWAIPELPLSKSFRCNDQIAKAVSAYGASAGFTGHGPATNPSHGAFIVQSATNNHADAVAEFHRLSNKAEVPLKGRAIVCRAHDQIEDIRGKFNGRRLTGKTKILAEAAFLRDEKKQYRKATEKVTQVLQEISRGSVWDEFEENPEAERAVEVRRAIWQFVKDTDRLPPVKQVGKSWIETVRKQILAILQEIGADLDGSLGHKINKKGLSNEKVSLLEPGVEPPGIRQETIHQVKGETIDAVLVLASTKFWNSAFKAAKEGKNTEDLRLAYVAMTRARQLLVVGLPRQHLADHAATWIGWGFQKPSAPAGPLDAFGIT